MWSGQMTGLQGTRAQMELSQEYACLVDRLDPEHSVGVCATSSGRSRGQFILPAYPDGRLQAFCLAPSDLTDRLADTRSRIG